MTQLQNERLWKLGVIEAFEKSDVYKILIEPLKKELEEMKSSYDCKTLVEMGTLKGKRDGLMFVLDEIERIKIDGEIERNKKTKIESTEEPKQI